MATLTTALQFRTGKQTIGVELSIAGSVYYIGTDVLRAESGQFIAYYPGLVSVTAITEEGAPGVTARTSEVSFAIRNDVIATTAGGVPPLPATLMHQNLWIGAMVTLRAWAEDPDGTWVAHAVFTGRIERTDITRETIEVRARVVDPEEEVIPAVRVSPASMFYGSGNPEGQMPEGFSGTGLPVAYGIFGPESVDMAYEVAQHHLAGWMGMICAPLLGMKIPMVPMPLFVDLYWKRASDAAPVSYARFTGIALGADWLGKAGSNPPGNDYRLPAWMRKNTLAWDGSRGLTYAPMIGETNREPAALDENFFYFPVFTWSRDLDRACPFARDESNDMHPIGTVKANEHIFASAIDWKRVVPSALTDKTTQDSKIYAIMLKRVEPDWAAWGVAPNTIGYWTGLVQAVALSPTQVSSAGGSAGGTDFSTSSTVVNPLYACNNDLNTWATIPQGDVLTLVFPGAGPTLGSVVAIRVCWLMRGPASNIEVMVRHPGDYLMGIKAEFSCVTVNANTVSADPTAGAGTKYGSAWVWKRREYKAGLAGSGKPYIPQWDFVQHDLAATKFAWNPEVRIEPINGACDVIAVWWECLYKPNLYANDEEQGPGTSGRMVWTPPRERAPGQRPFRWHDYNGNVPSPAQRPLRSGIRHFATGVMGRDLDGRWTGAANRILCNPADIAVHAIDYFLNQYSITERTGGAFGSFTDVRTVLDAGTPTQYRLAVVEDVEMGTQRFLDQLAVHAMSFIARHHLTDGSFKWRMFIDTSTYVGWPSRWWRSLYAITPDDVFDVRVEMTALGSVRNRFVLRYGFHEPTRAFAYEKQCTKDATNIASGGAAYVTACANSVTKYGREVEDVMELPWCWSHYVADQILKWQVSVKRDSRVSVRVLGSKTFLDVYPGHMLRLSDTMADFLGPYPGPVTGSTWDGHVFNVIEKTVRVERGMIMVELLLLELWTQPS